MHQNTHLTYVWNKTDDALLQMYAQKLSLWDYKMKVV